MSSPLMTEIKTPTLPALKPLLTDISPPTPYPLDAFTGVMRGAVMAIAEHLQVPTAIAGQCVIGANTHLAQTRVNAWHPMGKPGGSPCSLFMLTLAGSGEGKSSARKLAFKPIDDAEKEARTRHRKECAEIEAMAAALKGKAREEFLLSNPLPPNPQTQYSDATFEPLAGEFIRGKPAVSWDTDEGGQMLGGSSLKADTVAATLGGLTKGFDDGYFERTHSKANQDVSVRPTHLPNLSIKGDGVRVFLSGRDSPYRRDFHAPTKLLPQTIQGPGCSGVPATRCERLQRGHPPRHQRQRHSQVATALSRSTASGVAGVRSCEGYAQTTS